MAHQFGLAVLMPLVALITVQSIPIKNSSADLEIKCAVKKLDLVNLTGEWKYQVSQNGIPPELSNVDSVVFKMEMDGPDSIKMMPVGFEGKYYGKYVQPDPEENPGNLLSQLPLPDGELLEIPLTILAIDPKRYLATYSSYKNDWGIFVRRNVNKLTAAEFKNVARAMKCIGLDMKKKSD